MRAQWAQYWEEKPLGRLWHEKDSGDSGKGTMQVDWGEAEERMAGRIESGLRCRGGRVGWG